MDGDSLALFVCALNVGVCFRLRACVCVLITTLTCVCVCVCVLGCVHACVCVCVCVSPSPPLVPSDASAAASSRHGGAAGAPGAPRPPQLDSPRPGAPEAERRPPAGVQHQPQWRRPAGHVQVLPYEGETGTQHEYQVHNFAIFILSKYDVIPSKAGCSLST